MDEVRSTLLVPLAGGLLVGVATAIFLLGVGRIAGVSGIVSQSMAELAAAGRRRLDLVPISFVAGLMAAPWVWRLFAAWPITTSDASTSGLIAAGALVGVGVRMANGCTSGHGVCGIGRWSSRSLVNVAAFMGAGAVTAGLLRHVS